MSTTLNYASITERAEQRLRASLELAVQHRAAGDVTSQCLAHGAALGILSMWEGLVADLGALRKGHFQADRARLFAMIHPDTAALPPH